MIRAWINREAIADALGLGHDQQVLLSQTVGYPRANPGRGPPLATLPHGRLATGCDGFGLPPVSFTSNEPGLGASREFIPAWRRN